MPRWRKYLVKRVFFFLMYVIPFLGLPAALGFLLVWLFGYGKHGMLAGTLCAALRLSMNAFQTPITIATVVVGSSALVRKLLQAGAAMKDDDLLAASSLGHLEIARMLLRAGAPVDTMDSDGTSAVFKAAEFDDVEILRELLVRGADANMWCGHPGTPDYPVQPKRTALMAAAELGNVDAVCELLAHAATEVNRRSPDGRTAFSHAADNDIRRMLQAHRTR